MNIYYDDSFAGHGKTTRATARLSAEPIRAIYCCERIGMFAEIIAQIEAHAVKGGTKPHIISISRENATSVKRRVEGLPEDPTPAHTIVLISHAALMIADFSRFQGWSLVVDEVPSLLNINHVRTDSAYKILRDYYDLVPTDHTGWSEILPSREGKSKTHADISSDDFASALDRFHRAALAADRGFGKMLARLPNWEEASKKEKWFYANWFSFLNLAAFDSVTALGNGFLSSVDVQVVRKNDDAIAADIGETINWIQLPKPTATQPVKSRKVTIQYFQEDHATATQLSSTIGKRNLVKVAKYLNDVLPSDAIWSGNNGTKVRAKAKQDDLEIVLNEDVTLSVIDTMSKHMSIRPISPRQAGSNQYRHVHHCAIIYTANSSSDCTAFLKLNGLDANSWRSTKEHETALQIATRTSIRDADSTADVFFYVMDKFDANYLADYFNRLGHDVSVEFIDLDLEQQPDQRVNNGRKKLDLTADELAERKREQNRISSAKGYEKKKAAKLAEKLAA